jgi:excisionase family DNA binding protein
VLCHYAVMMPYAAYLRVYEPLSAFQEPYRSQWAAYAASAARPRRMNALSEEYAQALRRIAAVPPVVVPERESEHAYVRWSEGVTYICPWQTRLRSWLALSRLRTTTPPPLADAFAPGAAEQAAIDFARSGGPDPSARIHIRTSTWSIPPTWFVPFAPTERWMAGPAGPAGPSSGGSATASASRALVYATTMSQARRRVERASAAIRGALRGTPGGHKLPPGQPHPDEPRPAFTHEALRTEAELTGVGRWLEEFHPYSLVELDYGGLVHLLTDEALRCDESVAEIAAAVDGLARREWEVAFAMHRRVQARWWCPRATESANLALPPRLAVHYFRISPDATISIARITLSDADQRSNGASHDRFSAPGGRRVTAGDGNMVSVGHIGHQRQAPSGAPGKTTTTQDRNNGPGGEAAHMSARTPEAEPLLTPAEVATMFRVDPKTVTRWAKAGKLTSIRTLGGHRRYRETEVRALLAGIPQQRSE